MGKLKVYRYELAPEVEAVGLGVYLRKHGALLIADLHIGYEQALSEQGIYIPSVQYGSMKRLLEAMLDETGAEKVVIVGDLKHEFGSALRQEWSETLDLLRFLKERGVEVEVVRGNHDNFLIPILKREGVPLHDPVLVMEDVALVHGHKPLPIEVYSGDLSYVIMGHEHPAIVLRDELGVKMKFKCFLLGSYEGLNLLVLPAFSPLMPGTEVNVYDKSRFLSPILQDANIDAFRVFVTDLDAGIYDMGTVAATKALSLGLWSV